jgi:DNA-binding transcriptional regulator/RsmH inhibitor MraZ
LLDSKKRIVLPADGKLAMKRFRVTPRQKKYWVEVAEDDGTRRVEKWFTTEDAAVQYARAMQEVSDRAELARLDREALLMAAKHLGHGGKLLARRQHSQ